MHFNAKKIRFPLLKNNSTNNNSGTINWPAGYRQFIFFKIKLHLVEFIIKLCVRGGKCISVATVCSRHCSPPVRVGCELPNTTRKKEEEEENPSFFGSGGREAQKGLIVIETVGGEAERHFFTFFICEIVVCTQPAVESANNFFSVKNVWIENRRRNHSISRMCLFLKQKEFLKNIPM